MINIKHLRFSIFEIVSERGSLTSDRDLKITTVIGQTPRIAAVSLLKDTGI